MFNSFNHVGRAAVFAVLMSAVAFATGCGGSSPDDIYKKYVDAVNAHKFDRVVDCYTQSVVNKRAGAGVSTLRAVSSADSDEGKEAAALLKKYGFDEKKTRPDKATDMASTFDALGASLNDPRGFLAEYMAMEYKKNVHDLPKTGKLSDVKIDGDTATGTVQPDQGSPTPIEFKKEKGDWLINTTGSF